MAWFWWPLRDDFSSESINPPQDLLRVLVRHYRRLDHDSFPVLLWGDDQYYYWLPAYRRRCCWLLCDYVGVDVVDDDDCDGGFWWNCYGMKLEKIFYKVWINELRKGVGNWTHLWLLREPDLGEEFCDSHSYRSERPPWKFIPYGIFSSKTFDGHDQKF